MQEPKTILNAKDFDMNGAKDSVRHAMEGLARALRSAAYWCRDGYYTTESEGLVTRAKRDVYEEIASAIDQAFCVDSQTKTVDGSPYRG